MFPDDPRQGRSDHGPVETMNAPLEALGTDLVLAIAALRDPVGVLSVYADARPELGTGRQSVAGLAVRTAISELRARAHEEGPRERAALIDQGLDAATPAIETMLDAHAPGIGRALFAGLSGTTAHRIAVQLPFQNRVTLAAMPSVRPLVGALDAGRPAGIAVVSRSGIRVLEWHLGETRDIARFTLEPDTDRWRRMVGPADAGPQMSRESSTQEDRFLRRLEQKRTELASALGPDLGDLADNHGWDRLLVVGDERLTTPLADALPRGDHLEVLRARFRPGDWVSSTEVGLELVPDLEEARERRGLELATRARNAASSGGPGAIGLPDVLDALTAGSVHHLLLDAEREWRGVETPDGRLYPEGVEPPGVAADALVPVTQIADRMIERALATGATVSLVDGPASAALAGCDGVAALLRW